MVNSKKRKKESATSGTFVKYDAVVVPALFRVRHHRADMRQYDVYIAAETWLRAVAIAVAYCADKCARLDSIELMADTDRNEYPVDVIVLVDNEIIKQGV